MRDKQNIIWIASYPKSGNTWVRIFLHNLFREMLGEAEGAQDINALDRFSVWEHSVAHFKTVLGKHPMEAPPHEIAEARPKVQCLISSRIKGLALAKTHLCFGTDHGYPTIDLSVTRAAIYVVRNPLDVAISYAHHSGRDVDAIIASMATPAMCTPGSERNVSETMGSWSQHVASWMGVASRPVYVIRYEDMLRQPLEAFKGLIQFLSLRPRLKQLQAAVDKSSFAELECQERESGFRERPPQAARFFRQGQLNQWKNVLNEKQIKSVVLAHGSMMQRVGYLKQGIVRTSLDPHKSI